MDVIEFETELFRINGTLRIAALSQVMGPIDPVECPIETQ